MAEVTFDDLLGTDAPIKKTSLKIIEKIIAKRDPKIYPDRADTRANWTSPQPESLVLHWTETFCTNCGTKHEHPTYQLNSVNVRYRVSRFRTILKPYANADKLKYGHLPRLRETTKGTVQECANCFHECANLDADHSIPRDDQLDLFPGHTGITNDRSDFASAIKPFLPIDLETGFIAE